MIHVGNAKQLRADVKIQAEQQFNPAGASLPAACIGGGRLPAPLRAGPGCDGVRPNHITALLHAVN